jgi:tRNA A-37 threonylcarbamoyl transferase component Bud32
MKVCPSCGLKYPDQHERCFVDKAVLEKVPDPRIGSVLKGRYMIEQQLGEGGMAIVYRARNTLVDRPIAVKIMNPHLAKDPMLRERFRREAKNAAAVAHPNIIEIYDHGETEDGTAFVVMELLDGMPLDQLIETKGPLPVTQVAAIGVQAARGLARAHDFGVIHRDLKPENIFLQRHADGKNATVKLLDFGIARSMQDPRLTNSGEIFGTPQYLAPERVMTIDAGAPADLYALGVILFEMATGRLPFKADDIPSWLIKHMQEQPPPPSQLVPDIPPKLDQLILALLAKKPEERPVDAHAVVKALSELAPEDAHEFPPEAPPQGRGAQPVAATLPPTSLERWVQRSAVFAEMMRRAYPAGSAPPQLHDALSEITVVINRLHELRSEGLKEQRKLEQLEAEANAARERLGRAVHVLAEDLSRGREAHRNALRDVAPYFEAEKTAKEAYESAHQRLISLGGGALVSEPTRDIVAAARDMADGLDRWLLSLGSAQNAGRWVDSKQREITDLEFQLEALRAQLDRNESGYEASRMASEESLLGNSQEVSALEAHLTWLSSSFVEPLRERRDLGDLFQRLEVEGTPAAGIARA